MYEMYLTFCMCCRYILSDILTYRFLMTIMALSINYHFFKSSISLVNASNLSNFVFSSFPFLCSTPVYLFLWKYSFIFQENKLNIIFRPIHISLSISLYISNVFICSNFLSTSAHYPFLLLYLAYSNAFLYSALS